MVESNGEQSVLDGSQTDVKAPSTTKGDFEFEISPSTIGGAAAISIALVTAGAGIVPGIGGIVIGALLGRLLDQYVAKQLAVREKAKANQEEKQN